MPFEKLAHYDVAGKIGVGGMGEVYRARDTKLGRDVALKILPDSFAGDPERLGRFDREAKVLASLNHPNIGAIYGLEQSGARRFLVLELVEGEDLAQRLRRGPIPVEDVLPIARQICDALENAHEQGVIHRDLKPANIKVDPNGRVKVLDFGLAKALEAAPSDPALSQSPTIMTGGTIQGVILGTAAYMSPEQARGRSVDRRSDIFAFGCVLFEMLTGKQAFAGDTVSDTLAAVLRADPEWEAVPSDAPPEIARLLRRCLEKDAKIRLRDIGEARILIDRVIRGDVERIAASVPSSPATVAHTRHWVPWIVSGVLAVAAIVLGAAHMNGRSPEAPIIRASILPPDEAPWDLRGTHPGPAAISPDGRRIAFTARNASGTFLFVRDLESPDPRMLPGTQGAGYPFWSPDSRMIGFFADGKLKRIDAAGGPPIALCEAPVGKGGTWNEEDIIAFAPSFNSAIHKVSANGGESTPVTRVDRRRGENSHRFPQFLPDGKHFILLVRATGNSGALGQVGTSIRLGTLSDSTVTELQPAVSNGLYVSEHILFLRENVLMARPFDPDRLEFTGDAFPLVEQVRFIPGAARGIFDASRNGILVYQSGARMPGNQLAWFDASGKETGRLGESLEHDNPRISPDGTKVAVEIYDAIGGTPDIWIYDDERGIRTRFTFDASPETEPVWSPDGTRVAFSSGRGGSADIYVKSILGGGDEVPVLVSSANKWPVSWSPDGRFILYQEASATGTIDCWAVSADGRGQPFAVANSQYNEGATAVSPDGRWVAYQSDEAGRFEVYVTSFPRGGRKWQVSLAGGNLPRWGAGGRKLYYISANSELFQVDVSSADSTFSIGESKLMFDVSAATAYDITPDGSRILLLIDADQHQLTPLTLLTNWTELVEKKRR